MSEPRSEDAPPIAWRWRYLPWEGFPLGNWTYTEVKPDPERMTTSTGPIEVEALAVHPGRSSVRQEPTEPNRTLGGSDA